MIIKKSTFYPLHLSLAILTYPVVRIQLQYPPDPSTFHANHCGLKSPRFCHSVELIVPVNIR